jgi:deoxyribodipyrimidine photo-lyase
MRIIVWFRGKDLRVSDHTPLRDAAKAGEVIPVFVLDPYFFAAKRAQELPHRMQFLLESLRELEANIARLGSQLLVIPGRSIEVVPRLVSEWNAEKVLAYRWTEPFGRERDNRIQQAIGNKLLLHEGETLLPPGTLRAQSGRPYSVFTRFAQAFQEKANIAAALRPPRSVPRLPKNIRHEIAAVPSCSDLGILNNARLQKGGEAAARQRLRTFLRDGLKTYATRRDRLDLNGTSRLSADLKFGTLSIRQVWNEISNAPGSRNGKRAFLNELLWREFAYSTLWDRPQVLERPFQAAFDTFPWRHDEAQWEAWAMGQTGYPIVDASARQLLTEGFVPNRARMISASFLTKHLLIDYRRGEAHYLKYLTDGDWANNNLGWQWSAGCGCDAQPYFRVFNPVAQGQRFDPEGVYLRTWLPELRSLPSRFIHQPWTAPDHVLEVANVRLGANYPHPIVEHKTARDRFLGLARGHLTR